MMTAISSEGEERAERLSATLFSQLIAEEHRLQLQLRNVQARIVRFALLCEAEGDDDGDRAAKIFDKKTPPESGLAQPGDTKNPRAETRSFEDAIWH